MEKEILIMRLSAMGDVAMTVPVIASFVKEHPHAHITMLSAPRLAPLFQNIPNLTFFPVDTKTKYAGNLGMLKLFNDLRKTHDFDTMIDLHDVLRSKIIRTLFRLNGKKVFVIDKGRKEKKELVKGNCKIQLKNSIERYQEVFQKAGFCFEVKKENFLPLELLTLSQKAKELISQKGNKQWIGIAPFAQHAGKIYPLSLCEEVVKHFSQKEGIQLLLFGGGEKEKSILDKWASQYENTLSLVGQFNLSDEMGLMQNCTVLLSMDSANMHLASLVKTPVVSVWGATHPYAGFYGYGQNPDDAVQLQMECRPCSIFGNKPCKWGDFRCMNEIKPEMVISKLERHISLKTIIID